MIARVRHIPITPAALYLPYDATVGGLSWDDVNPVNLVKKGYNAAKEAVNSIGDAFESVGKWIGENVGAGAKWLWEHDPIMQLGYKIAKGENVWQALKEVGAIIAEDVRIFGPYLAYIPGVGTAAAMAIAAGVALANGKSLTEIAIETMRGAIPPGPALTAFDAANALLHGASITDAALEALHKEYPQAYDVVKAAVDVAQGGSISEAALSILRDQLPADPPELRGAFDAGVSIAKGKRVQDALMDGIRSSLPKDYQDAFDAAVQVANGKNIVDVALSELKKQLPPEAQPYADLAIALAKGAKVADVLIAAARAAVPSEYVKYFDMAMSLKDLDKGAVIAAVKAQIPAGTPVEQIYAIAKSLQTSGAATGGVRAVIRGAEMHFERSDFNVGGLVPTRAPHLSGARVGLDPIVNAALETAIAELKKQLPSDSAVQAAFQAGVDIIRGKSVEDVAMSVAKTFVPDEYKKDYEKAKSVVDDVVHGKNLGDVGFDALRAGLPADAIPYADLAERMVQSGNVSDAAIEAARAALPSDMIGAFDKIMEVASDKADFRSAAIAAVKSAMTPGQDLNAAFDQAASLAKAQIPQSLIDDIKAAVATTDAIRAAIDQWIGVATGKAIQSIAKEVVEGYIPDGYKQAYQSASDFVHGAPTSDVALNVFRQRVSAAGQHVVDSASALCKGVAPENIANDAVVQESIARVITYRKYLATLPVAGPVSKLAQPLLDRPALSRQLFIAKTGAPDDAKLREPDKVVVVPPSQDAIDVFDRALEDISRRRSTLGATNPYVGPPIDPDFQALVDEKVKSYNLQKLRFQHISLLKPESKSVKTAAVIAGGAGLAYLLIRRRKAAKTVR